MASKEQDETNQGLTSLDIDATDFPEDVKLSDSYDEAQASCPETALTTHPRDIQRSHLQVFERPEAILDTRDLGAGFTFGAPIALTPGHFTRRKTGTLQPVNRPSLNDIPHNIPSRPISPTMRGSIRDRTLGSQVLDQTNQQETSTNTEAPPSEILSTPPFRQHPSQAHARVETHVLMPSSTTDRHHYQVPSPPSATLAAAVLPKSNLTKAIDERGNNHNIHNDGTVAPATEAEAPRSNKRPELRGSGRDDPAHKTTPRRSIGKRIAPVGDLTFEAGSSPVPHKTPVQRQSSGLPNRPLKHSVVTRESRKDARTYSRSSNVSKKRTPHHVGSRKMAPSGSNYISSSPQVSEFNVTQNDGTTKANQLFVEGCNAYHNYFRLQDQKYNQKIQRLKDQLESHSMHVSRLEADLAGRDTTVQNLDAEKAELIKQLEESGKDLKNKSIRVDKVEEKARTLKEFLNSAVIEQQELFKQSRATCQQAINEIRDKERTHRGSINEMLKKSEAAEAHLRGTMKSVLEESKRQKESLDGKIKHLLESIEHRDSELQGIRVERLSLSGQLEDKTELVKETQTLNSQMGQILQKLENARNKDIAPAEEDRAKLQSVMERIESIAQLVSDQPAILAALRSLHQGDTLAVMAKIDAVIAGQTGMEDIGARLSAEVQSLMGDLFEQLKQREDALTQQLVEKRQENAMLTTYFEEKDQECHDLSDRLGAMTDLAEERHDQIRALSEHVKNLQQTPRENSEMSIRLRASLQEVQALSNDVASKTAMIAGLEKEVKERDQDYLSETRKFAEVTRKLNEDLRKQMVVSRQATDQAVDLARREFAKDAHKSKEESQKLLQQAELNHQALARALGDANTKLSVAEEKRRRDSGLIDSLNEELKIAKMNATSLTEQNNDEVSRPELAGSQDQTRTSGLQNNLSESKGQGAVLQGKLQLYDESTRTLFDRLKQWAKGNRHIKEIDTELEKLDKIPPRPHDDYAFVIKEMKQMDSLIGVLLRYHLVLDQTADIPRMSSSESSLVHPLGEHLRRVVLKSPRIEEKEPEQPTRDTIEKDRMRRRQAPQPKSIMRTNTTLMPETEPNAVPKPTTGQASTSQPAPKFQRGPYNRPVLGGPPQPPTDVQGDGSTQQSSKEQSSRQRLTGDAIVVSKDSQSVPRKRSTTRGETSSARDETREGNTQKRRRLSSAANIQTRSQPRRMAPIDRQSSNINSQRSLASSQAADENDSQGSSSGTMTGAKEGESQESITFSQDVLVGSLLG